MCGFRIEMATQLFGRAKLLIVEQELCADVPKRPRQLVVVGIATRQTIIIDVYLQLPLAQRRAVEMWQIIDSRARGVHGRLVDQMDFTEQLRVACNRERQLRQVPEKRHPRRAMLIQQRQHRAREAVDLRLETRQVLVSNSATHCHSITPLRATTDRRDAAEASSL